MTLADVEKESGYPFLLAKRQSSPEISSLVRDLRDTKCSLGRNGPGHLGGQVYVFPIRQLKDAGVAAGPSPPSVACIATIAYPPRSSLAITLQEVNRLWVIRLIFFAPPRDFLISQHSRPC